MCITDIYFKSVLCLFTSFINEDNEWGVIISSLCNERQFLEHDNPSLMT